MFGLATSTCALLSIPIGFYASTFNKLDGPGGFGAALYFFFGFSLICFFGFLFGVMAELKKEKSYHHISFVFCFLGLLPVVFALVGGLFGFWFN